MRTVKLKMAARHHLLRELSVAHVYQLAKHHQRLLAVCTPPLRLLQQLHLVQLPWPEEQRG